MTRSTYAGFVGVDIAAKTFTATWTPKRPVRPRQFDQTTTGYEAFDEALRPLAAAPADILVVMEATGAYWIALAVFLQTAGYSVAVINPAQMTNYTKSLPRRPKTDLLDAEVLLQFAQERCPSQLWTPPPAVYHELRQRLVLRDSLMEMRQQVVNQRHALAQWPVHVTAVTSELDTIITDFDGRINAVEREIARLLKEGAWAESAALLRSVPGIGVMTSAWLLVATVNFTLCSSAESLAAYAGLVPMAHESGTSVRGTSGIRDGGHRRLRRMLYMATMNAARTNPHIRTFYQRLRAAGKPFKVAHCAAARKLVCLAWAVVTKQQPFNPVYGMTTPAV